MTSMNSHLRIKQDPDNGISARNDGRTYRKFVPGKLCLERRLLLDGSKPVSLLRQSADVISIRQFPRQGSLNILGTSDADTVEIGQSARGFVTLTIDGVVHSGDLRDRAAFDRRLVGLRIDRVTAVSIIGDDPLDTVVLNTMLGTAARPAKIQSGSVTIAAPVNQAGTMRIEANTITVSAAVSADTIMLAASWLLNIDASGSLMATKSIELKADRLIQTGNIAAPTVSVTAGVAIRSGTISAPGGSVQVDFTQNYVATEGATIDVSAAQGDGGSIRIDGGGSGHLFNSGTLLAQGATTGGAIRVSGRDVVWFGGGADASGDVEGGLIRVGGGWQGSDASMTKARTLQVSPHTPLSADGGTHGGTVVLWSEESTTNEAPISATGGVQGGAVEVSSKGSLANGGDVKVGPGGTFLLDPKNIVIADNAVSGGVPQFELVNPTPNVNDNFGNSIVPLSTGNIVVTDPGDDSIATNAGAVFLYNGATGALISTLTGTTGNDAVANGGIATLSNGNYVVRSPNWNSNRGAMTWGSGSTGVMGTVSASNSLAGSTAGDQVGIGGVTTLSNGNYVVRSYYWSGNRGAVTWGSGTSGVKGEVSASNSLVGTLSDAVGYGGVTELLSGNFVIISSSWNGNRGAVTWGSGTVGVTGEVSASNSLVGLTASDQIGAGGVVALSNGNYVVSSHFWNGNRGAVTWGSGSSGVAGVLSASNSLVGSTANDYIGSGGVKELSNKNYLVMSLNWNGNRGAVTWGSGSSGVAGVLSSSNSLVGSTANDKVGSGGVTELSNNNFVVISSIWNGNRGAVTWGSGTSGVTGAVSATNSLVGTTAGDYVGYEGVTAVSNGNYLVSSVRWNNSRGAVTWGSGTSGATGVVSSSNSLVGSTEGDKIGNGGVTALSNGNYVVRSYTWNSGRGAVTWGSGSSGVMGAVSVSNSLIGLSEGDAVGYGGIMALSNGNYVVNSYTWYGYRGAVTWGSGTSGVTGVVSASNSLVGSSFGSDPDDYVGYGGITELTNGNYVVRSHYWGSYRGAVTWGSGTSGVTGEVSSTNSLVGSLTNDNVGSGGVTALLNGNYVVRSEFWDYWSGYRGAVTWGNGITGISGEVSSSNSIIGSTAGDRVGYGGVTVLSNGNYLVRSTYWDNGLAVDAGAVTWGNGTSGVSGVVSAANSLVGSRSNDLVGYIAPILLTNGNYVVYSDYWNSNRGAVTWGSGTAGVKGEVSSSNSLVGSTAGDIVGYGGISAFSNGNYVVSSPYWDNGVIADAGAITWMNGANGTSLTGQAGGAVSTANSFVNVGSPMILTNAVNGTYLTRRSTNGGAVYVGLQTQLPGGVTFGANEASPANMSPAFVATPLSAGTATTLQANNDITVSNAIAVNNPSGNGGALTLQAGRSAILNASVTTDNGALTVLANASASDGVVDAQRDAGAGGITLASGRTIDAGTGTVWLLSYPALGLTNRATAGVTLNGTITAGALIVSSNWTSSGSPKVELNGSVTTTGADGIYVFSFEKVVFGTSGTLTSQATGAPVTITSYSIQPKGTLRTTDGNLTFNSGFGVTDQIGNFTAITGSGAINFLGSWLVRSYSATLTTTATTTVTEGGLVMDGGSVTATAGLSLGSGGHALAGQGSITGSVAVNGMIIPRSNNGGTANGVISITSGGLSMTSNSTMYMDGTSAAAFDKVIADGVNLGGSTLNLSFPSFTLNDGETLTLIQNTSANPTAGAFAGLPEGAFLSVNGQMLRISYTGGDGNDVVVTPVSSTYGAFNVSYGGLLYVRGSATYRAVVTFTNASPVTLTPTAIRISGLPSRVQVVGGTQNGADWYLPWKASSVAASGAAKVTVNFRVLSGGTFTYSASAALG